MFAFVLRGVVDWDGELSWREEVRVIKEKRIEKR
jgi:hypothetical protein